MKRIVTSDRHIDDMYGDAYNSGIQNVIKILNKNLGTKLFYARDWATIDSVCEELGIKFDDDGEIVR